MPLFRQSVCEKWYGSHQQMHKFARESLLGPHGDQLGVLVPIAHIEQWHRTNGNAARKQYMESEAVRESLIEAADRTINRPDHSCPRTPYYAFNVFAMAFALAGMRPRARSAFDGTDGVVTGYWEYLRSDPVLAFNIHRDISRV